MSHFLSILLLLATCLPVVGQLIIDPYRFNTVIVTTNSLISHWNMNETSSTADRVDNFNGNDLDAVTTVPSTNGIISNAAFFQTDKLTHADNASLSTGDIDYCLVVWFYLDSLTGFQTIWSKAQGSPNNEYLLRFNGGAGLDWIVWSNGSSSTTATFPFASFPGGNAFVNTWYMAFAYHSAANNQIGVSVNALTVATTSTSAGSFDSNSLVAIGGAEGVATLVGRVDELWFYKRVLPASEVTNMYNNGLGRTCCPPQ